MKAPTDLVRPDTVIRLTCITRKPGVLQTADFVTAWKELTQQPSDGVLYRELNRQVPEWSKLAQKEIDNPVAADWLEYLIAEPDISLSEILTIPTEMAGQYDISTDIFTVAFRFTKETTLLGGALMFNLFEIDGPAGMEQGFLMDWPPRGEFKIQEAATISTMLHQRMLPAATYKAFNRAEVTSAAEYAEGIDHFEAAFPRNKRRLVAGPAAQAAKPPIRSHLGLFETVARGPGALSPERARMGAVVQEAFGPPAVLRWKEVTQPYPGPGQVKVRAKASSINPLDLRMRSGDVRHIYPTWFPDVLGYSVSGVIDAVGLGVTDRKRGEEVYGINNPIMRHGYSEYLVGPARFFYPKPTRLDWAAAAAAPSVFATAYGGLFLRAKLQQGQTVLIHGGAGVIGSCAVQLAKRAGAHVIATASERNMERVLELGADVVVDYRKQRFEDFAAQVDLVLDTVGGETRERSWPLVRKGGTLASLQPPPPDPEMAARYGIQAYMVHGHPDVGEIMPEMTEILESGALKAPLIAATYALKDAALAHEAFEKKAPEGRIVLVC